MNLSKLKQQSDVILTSEELCELKRIKEENVWFDWEDIKKQTNVVHR